MSERVYSRLQSFFCVMFIYWAFTDHGWIRVWDIMAAVLSFLFAIDHARRAVKQKQRSEYLQANEDIMDDVFSNRETRRHPEGLRNQDFGHQNQRLQRSNKVVRIHHR